MKNGLFYYGLVWRPAFILGCVLPAVSACTKPNNYYADRSSISAAEPVTTQNIEKRELVAFPYGKMPLRDDKVPAKAIITGADALTALQSGNSRYTGGETRQTPFSGAPKGSSAESAKQVPAINPHTAILACSDSSAAPETIFDQSPGTIFVVRNAGDVADSATLGSLEYAVKFLNVKLILVLGHDSCTAINTALNTPKGKSAGSKNLDALVSAIRPNLKDLSPEITERTLHDAVRAQVKGVAASLTSRSKIIKDAVKKDGLLISRGVYNPQTGKVEL